MSHLITTDDVHTRKWHCHIWYFTHYKIIYLLYVTHVTYVMLYIYLHSSKRRMRYDTGKIIAHGCKLHV